MIVQIICVQMGSHDYLIILAPHTPCGFQTDFVRFFGSNLAAYKTLITVIGNIPAKLAVTTLSSHHIFVSSFGRTVDAADIHLLICFIIVLNIAESIIQILIEIFLVGGLVRITGIVDDFFQLVFDWPESCCRHSRISSFRGSKNSE